MSTVSTVSSNVGGQYEGESQTSTTTNANANANQDLTSDPDCGVVDGLFFGHALFLILKATLKTDIFDQIERESAPVTVATMSTKHGYDSNVLERLLDSLVSMKLLHKSGDEDTWTYTNTRASSIYLTKSSQYYKGDVLVSDSNLIDKTSSNLIRTIKTGPINMMKKFMTGGKIVINANLNSEVTTTTTTTTPAAADDKSSQNDNTKFNRNDHTAVANTNNLQNRTISNMADSAEGDGTNLTVELLMKSMDAMIHPCRDVLPLTFDLSGHRMAVDLGGGTGYISRLLTDYYPLMSAIVFELPHVVSMVTRTPLPPGNRVSFVSGNFFTDDLPAADLYILSHVLHCWEDERVEVLLNKVFRSLPPGGKLLLLEKFLNERKDGPECLMNLQINMTSFGGGKERTAREYERLLEQQGFADCRTRHIAGINIFDALLTCKPF